MTGTVDRAARMLIIDAFAERPFAGNPAAVCLLGSQGWPDEAWMQRLAAELNLPMTAFVHPLANDVDADYALRWFTPAIEEKLCGHATLATAHALHSERCSAGTVRFSTLSGVLIAHFTDDGTITLDFPAATVAEMQVPEGLDLALGASAEAACSTGTLRDVLVVLADEATVRGLAPDFEAISRIQRRDDIRGITATAPADDGARGYDFVSRFFSPADGLPEDPVTGSAHTALAPYWSPRLGRDRLTGLQASPRSGLVRTFVREDRVELTGRAVTVLDGTLRA